MSTLEGLTFRGPDGLYYRVQGVSGTNGSRVELQSGDLEKRVPKESLGTTDWTLVRGSEQARCNVCSSPGSSPYYTENEAGVLTMEYRCLEHVVVD